MTTLAQEHDCLLLDLDGTVFRGHEPTRGRRRHARSGRPPARCTSPTTPRAAPKRSPSIFALWVSPPHPTTSSPVRRVPPACWPTGCRRASAVLIVGTESLAAEIRNVGLKPVRQWSDDPVAVVQGHSPETAWADLAEAALAIRGGALWVAANVDRTLPSERGLLPGNGSMVAALRGGHRPRAAGRRQAAADAADGCVVPRRLSHIRWWSATGSTPTSRAPTPQACPACWCSAGSAPLPRLVRAVIGERPNYIAADLRSLYRPRRCCCASDRNPAWRVDDRPRPP